ncbi:MAG: phage BR0599 family protein, partial [Sulfuritalea sp.]|nr:phage BR0599 family protein [Sulfuritalea sp.]
SSITVDDIRAGLWDYATVEVSLVNWADVSMGTLALTKGKLGRIQDGRASFVAELRGLSQHLQQPIGRLYMPACDADLGDSRCGVDLNGSPGLTVTGTITSVASKRSFADTGRGEADGYFDGGKITWLTGNNADLAMEVKTFLNSGGAFTLQLPMPFTVQVGDTYSVHAGCDKTFATCGSKFSNAVNYQGFPHLPGLDRLVSGGL